MPQTGWLSGTLSREDNSEGSYRWSDNNYAELLADDGVTAGSGGDTGGVSVTVQLVIDDARTGQRKQVEMPSNTPAYTEASGTPQQWDVTLPVSKANQSNFGIGVSINQSTDYYWGIVTGFNASIPQGATITEIHARVKGHTEALEGAYDCQLGHLQINLTYSQD